MATKKELEEQLRIQNEFIRLASLRAGIEKDIVSEINENTNILNDQLSTLAQQNSEKAQLKQIQRDIGKIANDSYNLLLNELGSLKTTNKLKKEQENLTKKINILNDLSKSITDDNAEKQQEIRDSISTQSESALKLKERLEKIAKTSDEVKKGWVGTFDALKVISKQVPGLEGPMSAAAEAARSAKSELILGGKAIRTSWGFPKSLLAGAKSLVGTIGKLFGPIPIMLMLAKQLVEAMFKASNQTAEFSNNLLVSRDAARGLRDEVTYQSRLYNSIAKDTKNISITTAAYDKALNSINDELGLQLNLVQDFGYQTSQNVGEAAMMVEQFGFSAKAATQLFKEATKLNIPLKEYTEKLFGAVGLLSTQSGLIVDINKTVEEAVQISGNLRANYRGSTQELASAVFQAKLLGLNLQQTEGIASSLLDFESSIQAEMEAELLTGRQLNLEKAREAALMGDTRSLMEEISKQGITQRDFLKMNIIQRQAIAKSLGMEVNEMADMFQKQSEFDALQKRNLEVKNKLIASGITLKDKNFDIEKASLQEIQVAAKAAGKSEAELRDILGEQIYARKQEESASRKFAKAMEQVKEVFSRFVDGGYLDILAEGIQNLAESWVFRGAKQKVENRAIVAEGQEKFQEGKISAFELEILKDRLTQNSGLARQIAEKYNFKSIQPKEAAVKDFIIKPMGEDTIVAAGGTNLGRTDEMVTELKKNNELLGKLLNKKGDINLDGQKVGEALTLNAYKIQ